MKKIGIIGCGWLGIRIADYFSEKAQIYTTTTRLEKVQGLKDKGFHVSLLELTDVLVDDASPKWESASELDAVIITLPFSGRNCCVSSLHNRVQQLAHFLGNYKGSICMMSTTSVYADFEAEVTEEDLPFMQVQGERLMRKEYPQLTILRLGGLMGDDRFLSKYTIKVPEQRVNHIHYSDICTAIERIIETKADSKLYNLVAPQHPTKAEVIAMQTSSIFDKNTIPKGKIISSKHLCSDLNFEFQYPDPRFFQFNK